VAHALRVSDCETELVTLRSLTLDDIDAMVRVLCDSSIASTMVAMADCPTSQDEAAEFLRSHTATPTQFTLGIFEKGPQSPPQHPRHAHGSGSASGSAGSGSGSGSGFGSFSGGGAVAGAGASAGAGSVGDSGMASSPVIPRTRNVGATAGLVGMVGMCNADVANGSAELWVFVSPEFHNRGFATSSCRACLRAAMATVPWLHRVTMRYLVAHAAMARLAVKLGFKHEGTLRKAVVRDGRYQDVVVASTLREEAMLTIVDEVDDEGSPE
jgi:RimJ/RimL family protein N-acetyltransferase